jgi:acetylglutamate kinase
VTAAPVVVKLGGELLADPAGRHALAEQLTAVAAAGVRLVVVHGGGPQTSELQRVLGIEPRIVAGRRVTDAATLEVAKMVFAGSLNTDLVAALVACGAPAVGVSGIDGGLLRAHRRPPRIMDVAGDAVEVDFGFVGDVDGVETRPLLHLLAGGYVPVIASLAADAAGTVLNVNADTIAAEIAVALRTEHLVVLTGVEGVYRDFPARDGFRDTLTPREARALVADGTASDGMGPKLEACALAVERGVGTAWIVDGTREALLGALLLRGEAAGTRITRQH